MVDIIVDLKVPTASRDDVFVVLNACIISVFTGIVCVTVTSLAPGSLVYLLFIDDVCSEIVIL